MKFHKGKITILLSALVILTIITSVLCSFTPPEIGWRGYQVTQLTETDVENLIATVDFQYKYGMFNGYIPVVCAVNGNLIRLYCVPSNATWTVTVTGNDFELNANPSSSPIMRSLFTATGFGMQYTGTAATGTDLLFYCTQAGVYTKNTNYTYSNGNDDDVIADCAALWYETFKVVDGYESALEEAESNGLFDGYNSGFADGLDQGYEDGFSNGFENGYRDGEYNGYAEGVSEGYSEGYRDGYVAGGSGSGSGEVETEIVYRDSVYLDIPLIFDGVAGAVNGIFSAVDFSLFGINILGVLLSITILVILVFVIKKFKS